MTSTHAAFPLRLTGELDPDVGRWQWLFKWLLAIPHFIVLVFLWIGLVLSTVVAGFAILFTGRYPRGIFDYNVGVLRWSWRVGFYSYSALGTDKYPPFSLADDPAYPARLEVEYPERLSRGLVLVKWWLLALPAVPDRRDLHRRSLVSLVRWRRRLALRHRRRPDRVARALCRTIPALRGSLPPVALRLRARPEPLGLPSRRLRGPHDRHLPTVPARLRRHRAPRGNGHRHSSVIDSGADRLAHPKARPRYQAGLRVPRRSGFVRSWANEREITSPSLRSPEGPARTTR